METVEFTNANKMSELLQELVQITDCPRCSYLFTKYMDSILSTVRAEGATGFSEAARQNRVAIRVKIEATTARRLISHTLTCRK